MWVQWQSTQAKFKIKLRIGIAYFVPLLIDRALLLWHYFLKNSIKPDKMFFALKLLFYC